MATLLGRDIRSNPAWNSGLLDIHRVRIDLEQTLDDIYPRAQRIWRARANLAPPPSKAPSTWVARRNAEITAAAGNTLHTGAVSAATVELAYLNANLAARLPTLRQSLTARPTVPSCVRHSAPHQNGSAPCPTSPSPSRPKI